MDRSELEKRTRKFALSIIRFVSRFRKNKVTDVIGYQLLKSGTSIGANYREAGRAESRKDFIYNPHFSPAFVAKRCSWLWLQGLRPRTPQAYPLRYAEESEGV